MRALGRLVCLVAVAAVSGLGCEATTMSAQGAPVPVLIGPVACIGCAPGTPPGPTLVPLQDRVRARTMTIGGGNTTATFAERGFSAFGQKVGIVVRDPCRIDVHVSQLKASALGVFALVFAMTEVEIDVNAAATLVANGTCRPG